MSREKQKSYRFNNEYREIVRLSDNTQVTLRLVVPADKLLLARGMDNFSAESRYRRFLASKKALTAAELQYLTEVDGVHHFAIGALRGPNDGVGVARFVCFGENRDIAEPAVAVIDSYQNKGLGKILFTRLMAAARERGIQRFHGIILASNQPMKHLLHSVGQRICFEYKGSLLEFEMPVNIKNMEE
jgi:GNAT superfamily N-acetyltransferase